MFARRALRAALPFRPFSSIVDAINLSVSRTRDKLLPPFAIVDSTLREGEQFSTTEYSHNERIYIAKMLSVMGIEYIEMMNPIASVQAARDCEHVAGLNLKSKILAHVRCHPSDVQAALDSGVDGVNIYMATSAALRVHSHGQGIDEVIAAAGKVIGMVKDAGREVRFSCEDAFRSDLDDILRVYAAVDEMGVDRVGVADTVGVATPFEVFDTVARVRAVVRPATGIEFHTHNDTGCCIANALIALEAGATHIDTSVLGIGERNGITPLGGFLARMYTINSEQIKQRYDLSYLRSLEKFVGQCADIQVPFNNYVTGSAAFTHKAGVHSKAVMTNPGTYEVLDPADFGVERQIQLAHRLTGWNAIQQRSKALALDLSDDQLRAATSMIKNLADEQSLSLDQIDTVLLQLSTGPRASSSQFVRWSTETLTGDGTAEPAAGVSAATPELRKAAAAAAHALAQYEAAAAAAAVSSVRVQPDSGQSARPRVTILLSGHIFDRACLNRVLDICVDSPCRFAVKHIDVGRQDELPSQASLLLSVDDEAQRNDLDDTVAAIRQLVDSFPASAECTMELGDGPAAAGDLL